MDDGEIEVSEHVICPNSESCSDFQASPSESFLDDLVRTCSHSHSCNPPGPGADDAAHSHTCYHTHTRVIPSDEKGAAGRGNREAVRKYREKKKAEAAHLEEEAKKLRVMNQVLMGKLQKQAFLEAQVLRLRSLVVGIRAKIDPELISLGENVVGKSRAGWEGNCEIPCEATCKSKMPTNAHLHLS